MREENEKQFLFRKLQKMEKYKKYFYLKCDALENLCYFECFAMIYIFCYSVGQKYLKTLTADLFF